MKTHPLQLAIACFAFLAINAPAAVLYVDLNSTNPVSPFTNWIFAATNIQDAIDASTDGDSIVVTNGIYQTGGRLVSFPWNLNVSYCRVAVTKPVTVQSVNGPAMTMINGAGQMRCAYLTNGASLAGFTLTNGLADYDYGGGVYCESAGTTVSNCILTACGGYRVEGGGAFQGVLENCSLANNSAEYGGGALSSTLNNCVIAGNSATFGGGVESCTLNNCTLTGNSASSGGGADNSTLNNCTLTWNSAGSSGGGADSSTLNNCIVYYNTATSGANYADSTLNYCCTAPLPDAGTNNITGEPQLAETAHISAGSPCIGTGKPDYTTGVDIDGEAWLNPPSIGCDEYYSSGITGSLSVGVQANYTNVATGFHAGLAGTVIGHASYNVWDFGDGTAMSNRLDASHSWATAGTYPVTFTAYNQSYPAGVSATVMMHVLENPVYCVSLESTNPLPPYLSWNTAATNIQDAVDAAAVGGTILVNDGVYSPVMVGKPVTVRSVNGFTATAIDGGGQLRCAYLANGTSLVGFALTNGLANYGQYGGGIYCESASATVSNCVITGNGGYGNGGGVFQGTLNNCTLTNNSAEYGGGALSSTLNNCVLAGNWAAFGGGADDSTLRNCALTGNSVSDEGGGVYSSQLDDCTLTANSAPWGGGANDSVLNSCVLAANWSSDGGGGAYLCTLSNCTLGGNSAGTGFYSYNDGGGALSSDLYDCILTNNSAVLDGGGVEDCHAVNCTIVNNFAGGTGGGADNSELDNCILYFNTASSNANYSLDTCAFNDSCTTPLPNAGVGNITDNPLFVDLAGGDLHLQTNSPCINAGNNAYVNSDGDLDGNPRIFDGVVDIGAYEFQTVVLFSAAIQADATNAIVGYPLYFTGLIFRGLATSNVWDFGDGTVVTNQLTVSHSWASAGDYPVRFIAFNDFNLGGVSATVTVHVVSQSIHYVSLTGTNPIAPYLTWDTAATNIQDAVDAAFIGGTVLVSNGVYAIGGHVVYGSLTNRVAITKAMTVQSVNGPEVTVIEGYQVPDTINDDGAVRCVYLGNGATLMGFTLANGATLSFGDGDLELSGGGVWCESTSAVVSNCVLVGNSASYQGGGAYHGTLNNCLLAGNSANDGGGACLGTLTNCTFTGNSAYDGGGASQGTLNNCTLDGNTASYGGGAQYEILNNCTLAGNSAAAGGGALFSMLTNCTFTGNSAEWGGGACGSTLDNCTLNANSADYGGGVYDGTFNHCTFTGNSAVYGGGMSFGTLTGCTLTNNSAVYGGGTYSGTVDSCTLTGNSASDGGGTYQSTLNNCTLTGNAAGAGGGAYVSTLNNCIAYYNAAPNGANYFVSDLNYCCTMPLPDSGTGNITVEPQLTDFSHISASSPCRGAGSAAYTSGVDIDGEAWANPPSIGCDEYHSGSITGLLSVAIMADNTNVAKGYAVNFEGLITGHANTNVWDFKDGTLVTNLPYASHNWSTTGDYAVKFTAYNESNPGGVSATQMVHVAEGIYYVALTSTNPVPPFGSWNTAATNIQAAVDVAFVGGTVLVSNGFYRTGVRDVAGVTNRVTVMTPYLTVASANGPAVTLIDGSDLVRCVYLTNNVVLSGFTLTNGNVPGSGNGGGVYCESTSVTITNCVLIDNNAGTGGGAEGGTLNNCTLTGNSAANVGGGADSSILNNCDLTGNWVGGFSVKASIKGSKQSGPTPKMVLVNLGGGAENSTLNNCTLIGNQAYGDLFGGAGAGGGADSSTLNNCTVTDNSADFGGGVEESTLNNCTLTGNSAGNNFGGADSSTLNNCIVYYNTNGDYFNSSLNYCCTAQPPDNGIGNITNEPAFVDLAGGDFHLQANSPCINAGNNSYVTTTNDLDGNPRIKGGTVDIGAYEYQTPTSVISYAWLQQYGLTNNGSADYADADGDGFNNWNEWHAGTSPVDPSSRLKMTTVTNDVSGITVTWQSVSGVNYFIQRGSDLLAQPPFSTIQSNIVGQANMTTYTDTTATNGGPYFYRVGVQ